MTTSDSSKRILMKTISIFILIFFITPIIHGQPTRIYNAFAFETITVSTAAIGFTSSTISPTSNTALRAEMAEYSIETCNVRYRIGTNPTATIGTLLTTGSGRIYGFNNIRDIKFIRDTSCSSDAKMSVHYYQ